MGVQLPNKYAHEKHPFYFMQQMAPLHMKTHDDAVRLIEMTEQAETLGSVEPTSVGSDPGAIKERHEDG